MAYKLEVFIGFLGIFVIEFLSGLILNRGLGLNLWDYSHLPLNIMGQITLLFAPIWLIIVPFAIFLDDQLRYVLFNGCKPYRLWWYYINLMPKFVIKIFKSLLKLMPKKILDIFIKFSIYI